MTDVTPRNPTENPGNFHNATRFESNRMSTTPKTPGEPALQHTSKNANQQIDQSNIRPNIQPSNQQDLADFIQQTEDYDYIGWIPCICGRLNYKNATADTALGNVKKAQSVNIKMYPQNIADDDFIRALAVTSTVNWRDRTDKSYDGKYKVMAVGKTDSYHEHSFFKLKVAILPAQYERSHFDKERALFDSFYACHLDDRKDQQDQPLAARIASRRTAQAFRALQQALAINTSVIENDAKELCDNYFLVEALLHPNGLIACRYIDDPTRDTVQKQANLSAYKTTKHTIIRQAFYYLKYVFHQHKHHPQDDDSVCTIFPKPAARGPNSQGHNIKQIGPTLVGNLIQVLTQYRRHTDRFSNHDLHHKGLLGYARSLAKSCMRVGFYNEAAYQHQLCRLDCVEQSFTAMVDSHKEQQPPTIPLLQLALQFAMIVIVVVGTAHLLSKELLVTSIDDTYQVAPLAISNTYLWQVIPIVPLSMVLALPIYLQIRKLRRINIVIERDLFKTHMATLGLATAYVAGMTGCLLWLLSIVSQAVNWGGLL